jgi:hypothetical protein
MSQHLRFAAARCRRFPRSVDEAVAFSWVSTADGQQTIENRRRALDEIAERAG